MPGKFSRAHVQIGVLRQSCCWPPVVPSRTFANKFRAPIQVSLSFYSYDATLAELSFPPHLN